MAKRFPPGSPFGAWDTILDVTRQRSARVYIGVSLYGTLWDVADRHVYVQFPYDFLRERAFGPDNQRKVELEWAISKVLGGAWEVVPLVVDKDF